MDSEKTKLRMARLYKKFHPRETNWIGSAAALKASLTAIGSSLDLPFKSIAVFVGSWMLLEVGWPLLALFGVATAGSVWSIPSTIPFIFIATHGMVLVSGANVVRTLVTQLGGQRDNLVKALFRGYFWSLLSIGVIFVAHTYFKNTLPLLFFLPIIYLLPIETTILGTGVTVPVPIFLGFTGWYLDILFVTIVFVVGATGACIGGIEILRYLLMSSRKYGSYGSIFSVLMLAVYPAFNIYFSIMFLSSIVELLGGIS